MIVCLLVNKEIFTQLRVNGKARVPLPEEGVCCVYDPGFNEARGFVWLQSAKAIKK